MPISPGSIIPSDSVVTPIAQQLALIAQQIAGITADACFVEPPSMAPSPGPNGFVLFPLRKWKVEGDTNAKLAVLYTFEVLHCFRLGRLPDVLPTIYGFVPAWFTVLTAWSNQQLGGLALETTLLKDSGTVASRKWGGTDYLSISFFLEVRTEYIINTQP